MAKTLPRGTWVDSAIPKITKCFPAISLLTRRTALVGTNQKGRSGVDPEKYRLPSIYNAVRMLNMPNAGKFRSLMVVFGLVALPAMAAAQGVDIYDSGGPMMPEQAAFDVTFYDIDLRVDPQREWIGGSVTTVANLESPTTQLVLNLDTLLTVSEVVEAGRANRELEWRRDGGLLWIDLGERRPAGSMVSVSVNYSGNPRVAPQAPWDGGFVWSETDSGEPWIATAVQGEGPDVWWPSKDHVSDKPDSIALHIEVPEGLVVATNGRPMSVERTADGWVTYHNLVSTPVSAYNIALNIAPYRELRTQVEGVAGSPFDVTFYVLPEDVEKGEELLPEIVDHLEFFERVVGPYPFRADGYKVAQTPHLGMEHQTVIAYGANFDNGSMTGGRDWGFDALHHHELAHEWWGNLVTNSDWRDMWLHEGFGTYMQVLYAEELGGDELMQQYLMNEWQYIANETAVAPRESRTSGQIYFDAGGDIYSKGAWVLHVLRGLMGDDDFFTAFRRMAYPTAESREATDGSQTRLATTDDFLEIAEDVSGMELDWFFDVYLRQPDLPVLQASRTEQGIEFRWVSPTGGDFPLPLEVQAGDRLVELPMSEGRGMLPVSPDIEVVVDPRNRVLRENQLAKRLPGR